MNKYLLPFLCLMAMIVSAQQQQKEFGKIDLEEIAMTRYDKDPDAKAVVLYDKGKTLFEDNGMGYRIRFTRHKRVKLFDKSETDQAEVSIPLYSNRSGRRQEKVKSLEAITYFETPDGVQKRMLDPDQVYTEKINDNVSVQKFTFPEVQDGAVLEYRYEVESPFLFSLPEWQFQNRIPTIYSEYQVHMVPFYAYAYIAQGISEFDVLTKEEGKESKYFSFRGGGSRRYQDLIHTYALKNIPAFEDESFITSVNDHIIKMSFQLVTVYGARGEKRMIASTWPKLNKELLDNDYFGKFIRKASRKSKNMLKEDLKLTGMTDREKAKAIIQYVREKFIWNGHQGKFASQDINDLLDSKTGSTADLNLLLLGMLDRAGIDASPLILSTRDHGKILTGYPLSRFTNYVAVFVNTKTPFLADATARGLPYNRLPPRCINNQGLVVDESEKPTWVKLNNNPLSIDQKQLTLQLDTVTNNLKASIVLQSTETEAYRYRERWGDDKEKVKKHFEKKIGEVERLRIQNHDRGSKPFLVYLEATQETEKLQGNIVIQPFLGLPIKENRLTQDHRVHPVDFVYPQAEHYKSSLAIPDGYKITDLPENYKINNPQVKLSVSYKIVDDKLLADAAFELKQAVYPARDYPALQKVFDDMIQYFNQPVVMEEE